MATGKVFDLTTTLFEDAFDAMPNKRVIIDYQNLFPMHGAKISFPQAEERSKHPGKTLILSA